MGMHLFQNAAWLAYAIMQRMINSYNALSETCVTFCATKWAQRESYEHSIIPCTNLNAHVHDASYTRNTNKPSQIRTLDQYIYIYILLLVKMGVDELIN